MGMTKRKSEGNLRKFHVSMADEAPETTRLKRRRRDPAVLKCEVGQAALNQEDETVIAAPTTVKRSSKFRGVSRHRWTGRYEAHLWDKLSWNITQKKKGKQGTQEEAARAYDIAAIEYRGIHAVTNFDLSNYIRWLKPGVGTSVPAQETRLSTLLPSLSSPLLPREEEPVSPLFSQSLE